MPAQVTVASLTVRVSPDCLTVSWPPWSVVRGSPVSSEAVFRPSTTWYSRTSVSFSLSFMSASRCSCGMASNASRLGAKPVAPSAEFSCSVRPDCFTVSASVDRSGTWLSAGPTGWSAIWERLFSIAAHPGPVGLSVGEGAGEAADAPAAPVMVAVSARPAARSVLFTMVPPVLLYEPCHDVSWPEVPHDSLGGHSLYGSRSSPNGPQIAHPEQPGGERESSDFSGSARAFRTN